MKTSIIPTGTLRKVKVSQIKIGERFRGREFTKAADWPDFVASIREKGILQPITLSKDLDLLAGERRLTAVLEIGADEIPALIREIEGELDMREIEAFENIFRADFTWWERARLTQRIDKLYKEKDLDWSGRKTAELLGKSKSDVARQLELVESAEIIPELAQQETAHDAYKLLKSFQEKALIDQLRTNQRDRLAKTSEIDNEGIVVFADSGIKTVAEGKKPEVAQLLSVADNNYRIGDVFVGLAALPDNGEVHVIECDPPYGINLADLKSGVKDDTNAIIHSYEEIPKEQYVEFLGKITKELYRVAAPNSWIVFWFGPSWFTEVKAALMEAKWKLDPIPAIWTKYNGQTMQPERYFGRYYEPFFVGRKGDPVLTVRGHTNVFNYIGTAPEKKYHPTERPIPMMREILRTLGLPGQVVLIPFLGSGATLRSAYLQHMHGFGFDLNESYKDRFLLAVEEDAPEVINPTEKR